MKTNDQVMKELKDEYHEIQEKNYKLSHFIDSDAAGTLPSFEVTAMSTQLSIMIAYQDILKTRIILMGYANG